MLKKTLQTEPPSPDQIYVEWKHFQRNIPPPMPFDRTDRSFSPTVAQAFAKKLGAARDFDEASRNMMIDPEGAIAFYAVARFAAPYLIPRRTQANNTDSYNTAPYAKLAGAIEKFLAELECRYGKPCFEGE